MGKKQQNQEPVVISEKKVNAFLGTMTLLIVICILGVNLYFRYTDRHKGDGFEYVDGVITKKEDQVVYVGRKKSYKTWITVEYTPKGYNKKRTFSGTDFSYDYLRRGETVRVYYKGGDMPRDVFIAKYDWLVKDYLPAYKSYNIPLIVSGILLIIAIYFYVDNPKSKNANPQSSIVVDPATGKMYDENLHQYSRFYNRRRGWKRFWIAGSFAFTFFTFMGIMLMITVLKTAKGDRSSIAAGLAFAGFVMIIGIGFVPLIITTMVRQTRRKVSFIKGFMADEATAVYSKREKAAVVLWKHVSHYMEKEMPWSRFSHEYSRFWLEKYKNKLEKYR